jgi:hypothetical protein
MSVDGFIHRWSKLKQSNRRGRAAPVAVVPEERADFDPDTIEQPIEAEPKPGSAIVVEAERVAEQDPDQAEITAAELRNQAEEAGLTPIEDLEADSDYTGFLGQGVPAALTKAALRKLWLSDPVFANLDGLNDYDLDYNVIDKILNLADTGKDLGELADKVEGTGEELGAETTEQAVGEHAERADEPPENEAPALAETDRENDDETNEKTRDS